ncbi:MAG TPA: ATP-binding protein [Caldimonas sp.]|nr:ATP-binding protein [Caldimonas sp.]HEX2540642.1 ATP-binding protein [Caldimonas sp.]
MRRAPKRLRTHLLRLTLGTLLPIIVMACIAAFLLAREERAQVERGAQERVRALSTAVDAEIRSSIQPLLTLTESQALIDNDLPRFHDLVLRVKAGRPDWQNINLALPNGQQVLNALRPYGSPPAAVNEWASFQNVLATGQPAVGDVTLGRLTNRLAFAVRVPVLHQGKIRYVLSAVIEPAAIRKLLEAQAIPAGQIATVVDRTGRIVARNIASEAVVGQLASTHLREAIAKGEQGSYRGLSLEGVPIYSSFVRSRFSGWTVATGIPASEVEAAGRQALASIALGTLLAVLMAFAVARVLGREVAAPVAALARQARELASGRVVVPSPTSGIAELDELARAFGQAGQAVQQREEVQRQLATVTGNASLALFMMDENQHCTYMNPAAEAMTGYRLEDVQGRALHDVIHHSHPDGSPYPLAECPIDRAFPKNDQERGEDVFIHASGRFFPVAFTASPIRDGGTPVGTVIEVRDISEEKRAEAERQELLANEQRARAEAETANRAKDEFLAMLGHELRNPLGAIGNASYVLQMRPNSAQAERAQAVIQRQTKHLTRLVDDLLDAGRVATGKIALVLEAIELGPLVQRVVDALAASGVTSSHQVVLGLDDGVRVNGDETRLEQIVTNLLTNAARYTPAGGRIDVTLAAFGDEAVLTVADSGIGISAELLPRVFDLFVQGERSAERAAGGLGIGLTLVRRLVQLQGGSVVAESAGIGQGSRFIVRMPRLASPAGDTSMTGHQAKRLDQGAHGGSPGESGARRILVVEDSIDVREMLCVALRGAGHEVRECGDGEAGLAEALAWRPDIALVDIGLPGLDGYEVASRIRAEASAAPITLIALTGYGLPEDRRRSREAGFDRHAVKPLDPGELLRWVDAP